MEIVNVFHGQQLLKAGNITAAEKIAQQALSQNPRSNQALELSFDCLMARNEYKAARTKAEEWLALDPKVARAHEAYILSLFQVRDKKACQRALEVFRDGFPLATLNHKLYEAMYDVCFSNGKKAGKLFEELSKDYPETHSFVKLQGDAAFAREQLFKACRFYREAIKLAPTEAYIWRKYAAVCFHIMHYGEARKAAKKALEFDPTMEEMKWIIRLSWIVYFPVFYLSSFLCTTYFYASEFLGKTAGMIVSGLAGYLIFGPILIQVIKWLRPYGIDIPVGYLLCGIFLWIAIEQGMFMMIDRNKVKVKNVELKDY